MSIQKTAILTVAGMVLLSLLLLFMGFPGNLIFGLWGICLVFLFVFGVIFVVLRLFTRVKKKAAKKSARKPAAVSSKAKR
ncbi:hypothetical protein [Solitalea canadensis]|nr:hypothetical protein [Solitalea canadensis]